MAWVTGEAKTFTESTKPTIIPVRIAEAMQDFMHTPVMLHGANLTRSFGAEPGEHLEADQESEHASSDFHVSLVASAPAGRSRLSALHNDLLPPSQWFVNAPPLTG